MKKITFNKLFRSSAEKGKIGHGQKNLVIYRIVFIIFRGIKLKEQTHFRKMAGIL